MAKPWTRLTLKERICLVRKLKREIPGATWGDIAQRIAVVHANVKASQVEEIWEYHVLKKPKKSAIKKPKVNVPMNTLRNIVTLPSVGRYSFRYDLSRSKMIIEEIEDYSR